MKILLANYRYFISGGPERYMFNVKQSLEGEGNDVFPFSIKYSNNFPSSYSDYFVSPLGTESQVYYRDQNTNFKTIYKTAKRLFYDNEVENAVMKIISEIKPDIAYVLQYLRKLSPALLVGIKKMEIPLLVRLSDYGMLCPQVHFLRNGIPCESCMNGNYWPSVKYSCVQNSKVISFVNYIATNYHHHKQYLDLIDKFITTNNFMYQKMVEAGYPEKKLVTIPTFVNPETFHPQDKKKKTKAYMIYVGRLEEIKGVHTIISAWQKYSTIHSEKPLKLKIVGFGSDDYADSIKKLISNIDTIEFLGKLNLNAISKELRGAYLSVIPSLCYENLPNTLLESYASGTPVIASNLGSLTESVVEGETGLLFEPGNSKDLAEKIGFCASHPELISRMSKMARQWAMQEYSPEKHIASLQKEFEKIIDQMD